ncbi:hypothetical protein DINM_001173 [Dirofilaria immitis]|nr:hypothetical protein [Dirofilaria immitis]
MEDKCRWIFAVPGIVEDNYLEKKVSYTDNAIKKFISRLEEFINYGRDIEKLCKTSNELKCKLTANLKDLETKAQTLEVCSLNPVDLANQRSMCQQLQTEYQNCRSEFETLNDVVSKLVEVETITRMKMKGSAGQSEQAQVLQREISSMQQRYTSLGSFYDQRAKKSVQIAKGYQNGIYNEIVLLVGFVMKPSDWLKTDYPITLVNEVIQTNIVKAKRLEEILAKEKQLEMEEIRSKARLLMCEPAIPGTSDIVNSQRELEIDWKKLNQEASTLKEWHENAEMLLEEVISLNKWLIQKDRMMSAIGTVNIDPKVIDNQLIQTELLRSELEDQSGARNKVNELAHNLVAGSATPTNVQQIVKEIDILNRRWVSFHDELETKKVTLQKIKELGSNFSSKQRDVKMQLIGIAEAIEQISRSPLISKNDIDEQLKILDTLSTRSSEIDSNLEEMKKLVNLICDITQDHSLQTDIREQLTATIQSAQELNKKIESMKIAATNTKNEEGQIITEAEGAIKWIEDMQEQLSDLGPLSVISVELNEQRATIEKIYSAGEIDRSSKKVANSKQKATLDNLSAVWNPLLEEIKTKHANAERAFDLVNQLETLLKSLTMHVDENRLKLNEISGSKAVITTGPSLRKLGREVENAAGDLRVLLKDIKNVWQKTQTSMDIQKQFSKVTEEAQILLDAAKETAEKLLAQKERELQAALKDVEGVVTREEAENFHENVRKMGVEYAEVIAIIQDLHCEMKKRDEMLDVVKQKISLLSAEIRNVNGDLSSPIERNVTELEEQNKICDELLKNTAEKEKILDELASEWQQIYSGTALTQTTQKNAFMQQINEIKEDLNKQRAAITQRKRIIGNTLLAVQEFVCRAEALRDEFEKLTTDVMLKEPIQTELNVLRTQQKKLRIFHEKLQPINQSYATVLERRRENKLINVWNALNKQIADREQQVCVSLQELGSYTDAHNALLVWLQDTEESLQNQRPPSIEYKVVKEQTRANDILLKHIEEKQQSIDGFKTLIDKVVELITDVTKSEILKKQADSITQRYAALVESVQDRRSCLHNAIVLTNDWAQLSGPFKTWLEATERTLQELGQVPTDEEKFKQQINLHQKLQESIEMKNTDVEKMMQLCHLLANLASDEEAAELETICKNYMIRYKNLSTQAAECGILLQQIGEEITNFLKRTNMLTEWLEKMENDMDKLDTISIYPEELSEQSTLLADLTMEITKQEALVSAVVEDGHELCRQTTGDEAIALQSRIEALRARYLDLTAITDAKIAILSEALPLSEKFHDGYDIVQQWMDAIEQDLQTIDQTPLETQATILAQMEDDLAKWRSDVEEISDVSKQLQNLVHFKADELEMQTDDMNRRFNHLAEQITCKGDKLTSVEKQSRQVLDELDYLNEWFADAHDRLLQIVYVTEFSTGSRSRLCQKQLKNQKQMNEDIAVMKARLRDAAANAHKIVRALGGEINGQDLLLGSKIETGRALSADVAQLGDERLAKLEQALALCLEIDQSFGELHSWLESMENEIENCPPVITGHQRDQLMQQQLHNTSLQHSVISHRPLMDRFHKNVGALSELCGPEDEVQLQKIAEGLDERFFAARDAVNQRAKALETAIEQSSQFTDRLDVVLANLDGAAMQIRNLEAIPADLERIKSQIVDNRSLMEQLKHKESVLRSVKKNAQEILMQAKPNDTGAAEISIKIKELDAFWDELMKGITIRESNLKDALVKAEGFWYELKSCQETIKELRMRIEGIQPELGEPATIEQQRNIFLAIKSEIEETKPKFMDKLRSAGRDLSDMVAEEEKTHVEQQINEVEGGWIAITSMCARKESDFLEVMEKAMKFHHLLAELIKWIGEVEIEVSKLDSGVGASSTDIRNELAALGDLRSLLDEKALEKEQLNQLCASLCVDSTAHQSTSIRTPISDLNIRWNKLYALLNERQQKMEKALLEMGQFSQAYEQLMIWIEKTQHVLNEINSRPTSIKEAEIEVCKHRVIQNEILVHEASIDTLNSAAKRIIAADPNAANSTQPMIDKLNSNWHILVDKLEDVWVQLDDARKAAENLGSEVDRWTMWLQDKDADLSHAKPTGGLPETAQAQLDDFFVLKAEIEQNRSALEAHLEIATKYLSDSDQDSWIAQRGMQLTKSGSKIALTEAEQLRSSMTAMNEWLNSAENYLGCLEHVARIPETIEKQMNKHIKFQAEVSHYRELMSDLNSKGTKVQCTDRMKQLDLAIQEARLYFEAHVQLVNWISSSLKWVTNEYAETTSGDRLRIDLEKHKKFQHELMEQQVIYEATYKRGKTLSEHAPREEQKEIDLMNEMLKERWTQLVNAALQKQRSIEDALLACGQFDEALFSLREWLEKSLPNLQNMETISVYGDLETVEKLRDEHNELKEQIDAHRDTLNSMKERAQQILEKETDNSLDGLREKSQTTEGESEILEQMDEIAQLHKEMDDKEPLMQSIKKTGKIYSPNPMKYWLKVLQNRWDEVTNAIDSKRDDLEMQLNGLRAREKMTADLLKLIDDHEKFEETLREKQALVDEATKSRRKFDVEEKVKKKSGKAFQTYENRVRHPKSDQLSSKWKKLWIESMDYGRQLREMKDYSEEVKRLESFSFEEWRERYLEWTDSGKARISDLFRRIDKSGTGRVPRSAFIDGIITSKFPTTRLEMEKVADEFDKGDGMIDSKEFMAKLRSEFSKKLPMKQKTDSEKITEEVVRQTERCNCINRYKIQKVGDGHYRFGETQIKRMVRILRSTVMVRVGGGWVALEEFLHKHDPCRAKGRTNLDLQRNFYDDVRPKDAYDTMETFVKSARSTPSRDSPIRSFQESLLQSRFQATPGPITKIREKTERSMPMYVTGRSSTVCRNLPFDVSKSNRKLSEMNGQDSKIRRPSASSSVSRSGSRGDMLDLSRPVSRSSDVSLDGDRPTRIPSLRGRKGVNYRSSPARASPQPRV